MMPYFTPASDPYFAMNSFYPSTSIEFGTSFSRLVDETLDDLIAQGTVTADVDERALAYSDASQIIMDQAAILPLYVSYNLTMASASVTNLSFSSQGWYPLLYDVYVEE